MSTYELDDDLVRRFLAASPAAGGSEGGVVKPLATALSEQLPIPAPTKIGAVVRTTGGHGSSGMTFIRWTYDVHSTSPWIATNDVDETYRTDLIGRITEVLSEGVDL